MVRGLRAAGVTIILTTHYIEEAEEMADRIGVINKGEIILVEDKAALMQSSAKSSSRCDLQSPLDEFPQRSRVIALELAEDGRRAGLHLRCAGDRTGITALLQRSCARRASGSRICDTTRARSRRSSSAW